MTERAWHTARFLKVRHDQSPCSENSGLISFDILTIGSISPVLRGTSKFSRAELQRLKPLGFGAVYVVAKATTHKDSRVLTQSLQPPGSSERRIAAESMRS